MSAPSDPSTPTYLTVDDLMAELRVSRKTIYRLLKRGEMSFVKTGSRSIRIRRQAFEAWRRAQEESKPRKGVAKEANTAIPHTEIEKGPATHASDEPDLDPKGSIDDSLPG